MVDSEGGPVSAFAVYSKMGKISTDASPVRKGKKRQSLQLDSNTNKQRRRSASVGNLTLNTKRKSSPKMTQLLSRKNVKPITTAKQENTRKKRTAKKSANGTVDPLPKSPKLAKIRSLSDTDELAYNSNVSGVKSTPNIKSGERKSKIRDKTPGSIKKSKAIGKTDSGSKKKVAQRISSDCKKKEKINSPKFEFPVNFKWDDAEDIVSSIDEGKRLFEWLISPVDLDTFFKTNWEISPLCIRRHAPEYYKHVTSTPLIDSVLRNYYLQYTKNVDITSYTDGKRETHNPVGRALPSVVWDYYMNGCSVRLLNPQTFMPRLHKLNTTLQEYFGCFVGANAYLTPPNSQGFAPHYDDIEAFILQIEGKKRWRLYKPRSDNETLPRFSSGNFDQSELGQPMMDMILEAGDLLYFPRGTIHQAETIADSHSLHVTLSVYQKNSWGDFFEKLLPEALQSAITNDVQFREGLPLDYLQHVGLTHSLKGSDVRKGFIEKAQFLLSKLRRYLDVDKAADEMAKKHIHDFLPPVLKDQEKEHSVFEDGERMIKNGKVVNRVEIEPDTSVRLARAQCVRLVQEEDGLKLYYSNENSKEYHEYEPQYLEVAEDIAPAINEIILQYPNFIKVEDLSIDEEENKIQVVKDLWEKGILITEEQLVTLE